MKKKLIPLLSALLTVILLATLALFSVAENTEPKLKIAYCTLEFGQDTHILYAVSSEGVENVDDIEVLVWKAPQTDYTSDPDVTLKISYKETINNVEHAVFEFTDLGAMNMADNYYACAHVKVDGEDIYSPVNKYSVLQYAYNMLGKAEKTATTDEKLKNLLNTMLNYGSNVQVYADYKTERLSNDKWYYVKVNGGTLEDGFDHGLYLKDDEITVTLNDGESFSYWVDSNGNELSDKKSFKITVSDLLGEDDEKTVITISAEVKASEGLSFTSNDDGTCYVSGIGTCTDTDIVIPKTSPKGDKVTGIGENAFQNCKSLTSIIIPGSVTSIGSFAFSDCTSLTSITIGNGVTSIGGWAFEFCTNITSITIPDSVTSISSGAFRDCTSLTSITIGNDVTSIGDQAFYNCTSLTSITIPDSVTSIGQYAFSKCTSLTNITIPDSVTSINYNAFYNTAYYNNDANWTDGVLYIGNHLIKAKDSISGAYTIKNGTKCIADSAFYGCYSLTSITIPDGVTSIGYQAFYDTAYYNNDSNWTDGVLYIGNHLIKAKTSISGAYTIKKGTKCIADRAFWNCSSLTSITIPDSVTSIGSYAFSGCTSLESITVEERNSVYHSEGNCLIKTATKELFFGCKNSVIPTDGSVTSIGGYAFYNCTSLTSITIPDSVTSIGSWVFSDCTSLTSITIPDSVTSIGYAAFDDCTSLRKVYYNGTANEWSEITIDSFNSYLTDATRYYFSETEPTETGYFWHYVDEVPTIWKMTTTFNYTVNDDNESCRIKGLVVNTEDKLIIPETIDGYKVTAIGYEAFEDNKTFTSVIIPNSVTSIGYGAFYNCTSLESVTIGNGVTSIGNCAFWGCTSLASVTIGNSVTSIGYDAFYDCTSLTSITIPDSVTSIGKEAFRGCSSLNEVYYTGNVESWLNIPFGSYSNPCNYGAKLFFNNELVTTVIVPNAITKIGNYAFCGCTSLKCVTISEGVTSIGDLALLGCTSLESITIPDSVTYIGYDAFLGCTSLTSIIIPNSVTSICHGAFGNKNTYYSVNGAGVSSLYGCLNLDKVYYKGTADEWLKINIDRGSNNCLTSATCYYYSESEPTTDGNFWYYDASGNVTEW